MSLPQTSLDMAKAQHRRSRIDQAYQDRPGNKDIQLSILSNAKRNLDVYNDWQEYFRKHQPPYARHVGQKRWHLLGGGC